MPEYEFRFEAIHANWPAYPAGHGVEHALETLCLFPQGTHFLALDDIDLCILFVADELMNHALRHDQFSDRHFHVALWHEDLRKLRDKGFLTGFKPRPTADSLKRFFTELAKDFPDPIRTQAIEHINASDWEDIARDEIAADRLSETMFDKSGIVVTAEGWGQICSSVTGQEFPAGFERRGQALMAGGLHDSAIREAAIFLESSLRKRTGTTKFGQSLVQCYMDACIAKAGVNGAFQRHLRTELVTLFKFVRNDFAHNLIDDFDKSRCQALLSRITSVSKMLDYADSGAGSFQDVMINRS